MDRWEAENIAEALQSSGYNVGAYPTAAVEVGWQVKGPAAANGWTAFHRMPMQWQTAVNRYYEKQVGKMDHQTADRYQSMLYDALGDEGGFFVTEQGGRWGVCGGDERYFRYEDFPEHWKQAIHGPRREQEIREVEQAADLCEPVDTSFKMTVRLSMRDLGLIIGQLQIDAASLFKSGDESYASELERVVTGLASEWRIGQ